MVEMAAKIPLYLIKRIRGGRLTAPPVFIVGAPHSGTSLLLAILSSHSKFAAIGPETHAARRAEWITRAFFWLFDVVAIADGKSRWVEKTPQHIFCIDKIMRLRPGSKFIIIIRDGRDVSSSIKGRTGSIEQGINVWIDSNRAGQQFWDHPNVHVVQYGDIIDNFEGTLRPVFAFLEEDYEPEVRNFHTTPKHFYSKKVKKPDTPFGEQGRHHRNWQINQPLFDGRGRWKDMNDKEKNLVKQRANDMLIEYGFVKDDTW
jgi:hypothetical protein